MWKIAESTLLKKKANQKTWIKSYLRELGKDGKYNV